MPNRFKPALTEYDELMALAMSLVCDDDEPIIPEGTDLDYFSLGAGTTANLAPEPLRTNDAN